MSDKITTNYQANLKDIANGLVDKSYIIDRYPELYASFKQAGLWMWGFNLFGQIGNNAITNTSSPVQTILGGYDWKTISGGINHTGAIKNDGTLWCWGNNQFGSVGDNTAIHRSSPQTTVAGGTNWKTIGFGNATSFGIKTDGTLWSWGVSNVGQSGRGTVVSASSPVQVGADTNWKIVSSGNNTAGAIKTDGTLWTWGHNILGTIGNNSTANVSSPVQTSVGGSTWKQLAVASHIAATKTDGTLWLWGNNQYGQVGDNSTVHRSSPQTTVAGGTDWKYTSASLNHSAAIKNDGTLWTWGFNAQGQLGSNSTANRSSPQTTVAGGTDWLTVACGANHTVALKQDGTLWVWGYNNVGSLGDNSATNRTSPRTTVVGGTNWISIATCQHTTMAIADDSQDQL